MLRLDEGLGSRPFVATDPAFVSADSTADGWALALPAGTATARVFVFSGDATDADVARARAMPRDASVAAATAFWGRADIPYGHVRVPDAGIQSVLDMGLRTLYQGRETVDGRGQFNSSFTLYRGLWTGDAAYFVDLAAVVGDRARAREALDGLFYFQTPEGLIEVMKPFTFWRESAMTVWTYARYARLALGDAAVPGGAVNADDRTLLDRRWPDVMRIVEALRRARQTTVGTGTPYDGLFPPAFNDGGIGQISAEYSSVLWTMTALVELGRVAGATGRTEDAARLAAFYTDLRASFDVASARDMRTDAHGHRFLPVPVAKTGPDETPQLAQWAALEAHLFSDYLPLDGDYLTGTLGVMQDAERQGLPISTGWLPGGVWAGFGYLYGMDLVLTGHDARAADILYAMANHASPVGTWVEEQPLVGAGSKLAGDMPHNWHPTVFHRMAVSMLALDRGDDVLLLGAVPVEWLGRGDTSRLVAVQTIAGPLDLSLVVSPDGNTATLHASALGRSGQAGRLSVRTRSLVRAGFRLRLRRPRRRLRRRAPPVGPRRHPRLPQTLDARAGRRPRAACLGRPWRGGAKACAARASTPHGRGAPRRAQMLRPVRGQSGACRARPGAGARPRARRGARRGRRSGRQARRGPPRGRRRGPSAPQGGGWWAAAQRCGRRTRQRPPGRAVRRGPSQTPPPRRLRLSFAERCERPRQRRTLRRRFSHPAPSVTRGLLRGRPPPDESRLTAPRWRRLASPSFG